MWRIELSEAFEGFMMCVSAMVIVAALWYHEYEGAALGSIAVRVWWGRL